MLKDVKISNLERFQELFKYIIHKHSYLNATQTNIIRPIPVLSDQYDLTENLPQDGGACVSKPYVTKRVDYSGYYITIQRVNVVLYFII